MRNFKRILAILIFFAICFVCNSIMTYLIYPYNNARLDIHNIETKEYDDIFLGTSHGKCSINPLIVDEITKRKSTNICMGGEYVVDVYFLVKEIARNHVPKRIIYELDPGYWVTKPAQGKDYTFLYHEFPFSGVKFEYLTQKMWDADFRTILFPWYSYRQYFSKIPSNFKLKQSTIYKEYNPVHFTNSAQSYEDEGFIYKNVIDEVKTEQNLILWDENELEEDSVKYFEKLVEFCNQKDIELVVITTPIPDVTLKKYQTEFDNANEFFSEYLKNLDVPYYNFNYMEMKGFDRSLDSFGDYEGHMYGHVANEFSKILAGYL